MESEDRLIDLLRAYVRDEAPTDIWQVVSTDLSGVLRKIIALSAECQRAKMELEQLKKHVKRLDENYTLPTHLRHSILQHVNEAGGGEVNMSASIVQPQDSEGFFLAPGQSVRLPRSTKGDMKRPFLHWCKVCNELSRSHQEDPHTCPRRECRSAYWRTGRF